jgi:TPR repeat protein
LEDSAFILYRKVICGDRDAAQVLEALSTRHSNLICKGYFALLLHWSRIYAVIRKDIPRANQYAREFLDSLKDRGITVTNTNEMSRLSFHEKYLVGRMLYEGIGILVACPLTGISLVLNAAQSNHPEALYYLGNNYQSNFEEKEKAWTREYLELAAKEFNHPQAQCALGTHYLNGTLFEQNVEIALGYYQQAADQGYALAQYLLANYYETISNFDEAMRLWILAAEQGYTDAIFVLGDQYFHTQRVYNLAEGLRWYRRNVELGDIEVIHADIFILKNGHCGLTPDPKELERLLKIKGHDYQLTESSPSKIAMANIHQYQVMSRKFGLPRFKETTIDSASLDYGQLLAHLHRSSR